LKKGENAMGSEGKLLFVEDEKNLLNSLSYILEHEGFTVLKAASGEEALVLAGKHRLDIVLLDISLPGIDGFEVAERLRKMPSAGSPCIIMLTGSDLEEDMIRALTNHADDYITKPVRPRVLLARIAAVSRRVHTLSRETNPLCFNGLRIDPRGFEAVLDGRPLELTKTEFDILLLLAENRKRAYSRAQIISSIRGDDYNVTERSIDYQVFSLRKKLGAAADMIQTVHGVGYRFRS
jgi:two-component system, OmpR family, alkaline phosphatase synthesis response regulator PhoP